jgi:phosphomannomutase/phosphoglucomutase
VFSLKRKPKQAEEGENSEAESDPPLPEEKPKQKEKRPAGKFTTNSLIAIILVLLCSAGAAAAVWLNAASISERAMQENSKLAFANTSSLFEQLMRSQVELVRIIAADPQLEHLFAENDQAGLINLADRYATGSADLLKLHFVHAGELEKNSDSVAPVSYATIDMVNRAATSKQAPLVEIHSPGSAASHIAIAVPVLNRDTQQLLGIVHAALSPIIISDAINAVDRKLLTLQLEQVVGDNVAVLASSGKLDEAKVNGQADIAGTIWRLKYQAAAATVAIGGLWSLYAIVGIAVLLIVVLVVLNAGLGKALAKDAEVIAEFIRQRSTAGRDAADTPAEAVGFAEMRKLAETIAQINLGGKAGAFSGKKISRKPADTKTDQSTESPPSDKATKVDDKPKARPQPKAEVEAQAGAAPASGAPSAFPSRVSQSAGDISAVESSNASINPVIFREYDIRGIVGETLQIEDAYGIGQAIGTMAVHKGNTSIIVGRDGRLSSHDLSTMLIKGLVDSGLDVIDIGLVPTPVLYFAANTLETKSGVMVTGSHNPGCDNGFKVVINGEALTGDEVGEIYRLLQNEDDLVIGVGEVSKQEVLNSYVEKIKSDVNLLNKPKIVVDCGHGAAGVIAEKLFTTLGCEVTMLYDNVDGNFPDHHPDPGDVENMQALIAMVTEKGADLGIAFDGDGDRLGVVDSQGNLIAPDRLLMLLAADLLMHNPGVDVIYDVKSSKALAGHILASGGNPVMWKSGHSLMKAKLRESGALLAGEYSGHIFYAERWYGFDDALYSAVRLLEILSAEGRTSAEVFAALPNPLSTPEIRVAVEDGTQQTLMETIHSQALVLFGDARIVDIDGIRAEYANGWGLVRASNTTPYLTLRFEADDENAMNDIKDNFRSVLSMVLPDASISF